MTDTLQSNDTQALPRFYRVRDVRELLGNVSKSWVYDRMKDGSLDAKRLHGVILITEESLERLIAEMKPWR